MEPGTVVTGYSMIVTLKFNPIIVMINFESTIIDLRSLTSITTPPTDSGTSVKV